MKPAGNRHEDTTAWLAGQGIEVCPTMLGERVTYQDAYAQGLGVSETEPSGKAAQEIKLVYSYTSNIISIGNARWTLKVSLSDRTSFGSP